MLRHKIGGLPVVDGGKLVGVITESDIFRAFVELSTLAEVEAGGATPLRVEWGRPSRGPGMKIVD